jgi:hypothetical protein
VQYDSLQSGTGDVDLNHHIPYNKYITNKGIMPNHCYNRVDIGINSDNETAKEQFKQVLEIFESQEPFNRIIPEPNWSLLQDPTRGEFSKVEEMKSPNGTVIAETRRWSDGQQDDRWYNWRNDNWGTKWEAYDKEIVDADDDCFQVTFNTAWAPPEPIADRLKMLFPDLYVQWFYDEPGMEIAGYL